jgi:hypothetical protein
MGSSAVLVSFHRVSFLCAIAVLGGCDFSSSNAKPDSGTIPTWDTGIPNFDTGAPTCTAPAGAGTQHASGSVRAAETWTAAGSPHIVPSDMSVTASITLEACAVVQIAAGKTVTFGPGGDLVAQGTASQPVTIDAVDPQMAWASLRFIGGTAHLSYTTVAHGGNPLNAVPDLAAALDVRMNPVLLDHVTVTGSASNGLYVHDGGSFDPASTTLAVTGAARSPVHTWTSAAGGLPSGMYTGNGIDQILLSAEGCTAEGVTTGTVTLRDLGVPYAVGYLQSAGQLCVAAPAAGSLAKLAIDPGVTMRFKKGAVLTIEQYQGTSAARGALVAAGTAAKPIVFTSGEPTPAAGDWLGIWFGQLPDVTDKIDFARVEYAGGASTSGSDSCSYTATTGVANDAAIRIFGVPAGGQFVTNTTLTSSAAHGIDRGFRSDAKMPDFLGTNTFTNLARCKQTYPRDVSGACPAPTAVPCP